MERKRTVIGRGSYESPRLDNGHYVDNDDFIHTVFGFGAAVRIEQCGYAHKYETGRRISSILARGICLCRRNCGVSVKRIDPTQSAASERSHAL